jgi:hypothetical protein
MKPVILQRVIAFALCWCGISGCQLLGTNVVAPSPDAIESTAGSIPEVTPFLLEVIGEVNDGDKLIVNGRFVPKIAWDPANVLVRLSALDAQGQQRQSYFAVAAESANAPFGQLEVGSATEFTLSLPSKDISNYQIELLWGQDAAPFQKQARSGTEEGKEFLALRNLEVYRMPSDNCASPNECTVKFTVTGEFFNAGSAIVSKVVLKAGFARVDELDLRGQKLENERRIEVRNMHLGPASTRPFRLVLDKLIPLSDQIAPRPVVQILSFESE